MAYELKNPSGIERPVSEGGFVGENRSGHSSGNSDPEAAFKFSPKQPLGKKLSSFLDWAITKTDADGGFLSDSQGLPLVSQNISLDYIESTGALSQGLAQMSAYGPNTSLGWCSFLVEGDKSLWITWAETSEGKLFFGLVTRKNLNIRQIQFIRMTIQKIVG